MGSLLNLVLFEQRPETNDEVKSCGYLGKEGFRQREYSKYEGRETAFPRNSKAASVAGAKGMVNGRRWGLKGRGPDNLELVGRL